MDFFRRRRISLKKESKSFDLLSFFWRRLPDGAFAPIGSPIPPYGSNKKSTPYGVLFLLARVDKKDATVKMVKTLVL